MNIRLDPAWKQAVLDLIELDPQPGYVVTKEWLREHFELTNPPANNIDAMRTFEFKMLDFQQRFFTTLEQEHSLIFTDFDQREHGRRLLAPSEVAEYEEKSWQRRVAKELRRTIERLKHTDQTRLTSKELDRHFDVIRRRNWQKDQLKETKNAPIPVKYYASDRPKIEDKGEEE